MVSQEIFKSEPKRAGGAKSVKFTDFIPGRVYDFLPRTLFNSRTTYRIIIGAIIEIRKKSVYKYKQTSSLHGLRRARFAKHRNSALPAFNSSFSLSHTEICLL